VVALHDVLFTSIGYTTALPVVTLPDPAVNHLDRAQDLTNNSNFIGFQVSHDAPATLSSSADDARMQGMRSSDFLDSPQPGWVRPAGSSVSNEGDTHHVPNNRTCRAPANRNGRISHKNYQADVDNSRGIPVSPALEVKRSVVGSRGVTAATKARRKDPNQPGRFLCEVCGADLTANHNMTSKVVRYWSFLPLIVPLQTT
jgi:hypothetical protein